MDKYLSYVQSKFDFSYQPTEYVPIDISNQIPTSFKLGVVVGSSGTGKTRLVSSLEGYSFVEFTWDDRTIIEQLHEDPKEAVQMLYNVGFSSIPQWFLKYEQLSEGQKFRCYLARCLNRSHLIIDEFTSKLDRLTARNTAYNLSKFIHSSNTTNVIIVTPFRDIVTYLQSDWIYDTSTNVFTTDSMFVKVRWTLTFDDDIQDIDNHVLHVRKVSYKDWEPYAKHHYLSSNIVSSSNCYEAVCGCEGVVVPIAFIAVANLPTGGFKARREHRLVVLPEVQGMGIGATFSEFIANFFVTGGFRYYCKTSHPKLGEYRNAHTEKWAPTGKNGTYDDGQYMLGLSGNKKDGVIAKKYYCHEYYISNGVIKEDETFETPELIDPAKDWKPTSLIGVIKDSGATVTVIIKHKKTYFRTCNYGNNVEATRQAAQFFLEETNLREYSPNLYRIEGDDILLNVDTVIVRMTRKDYNLISKYKLFWRRDTGNKRLFYTVNEEGRKKRVYIDEIVSYTFLE